MEKHIHRYRRINIGQAKKVFDPERNRFIIKQNEAWVMKCTIPGCTHYVRMYTKLSCPILKGNIAVCNRCEEQFILNKRALRMEEPCCDECVNRKTKGLDKAEEFFKDLERSIE